ncbi:MAG: ATP:cob(I)alamin adenosyltransferase, partial [Bdellovibrionales bacterium]|nr:ATP:cob(I)alamin adenosyltransferase [Bdellovibrionales bacterium]
EPDHKPLIEQLLNIQNRLFNIGSLFACPEDRLGMVPPFEERWVSELEQAIDTMDSSLSPLKNFILPSGHISSVYCHLARTVCRRCERHSIPLLQVESLALSFRYLNRLSDYFFALARYLNHLNNVSDNEWKK